METVLIEGFRKDFTLFTVIVLAVAVISWARSLQRVLRRESSRREFIFWTVLWGSAIAVICWPGLTDQVARRFGVARGSEAVVYTSLLILFYLMYRIYAYLGSVDHEITRLVRELAIRDAEHTGNK